MGSEWGGGRVTGSPPSSRLLPLTLLAYSASYFTDSACSLSLRQLTFNRGRLLKTPDHFFQPRK
jgi:hypothetical protein